MRRRATAPASAGRVLSRGLAAKPVVETHVFPHIGTEPLSIAPGDAAPDFILPDAEMQLRSLSDLTDKILVLYFYPRDDTPGCTLQATDFSEMVVHFSRARARVVGVSQDDCFNHQTFRDKHGLKIMLLSDVDGEACTSYGVLREKEKNGIRRVGIVRSTFVIDRDRIVRYARYGVSPGGHARDMLGVVKSLPGK